MAELLILTLKTDEPQFEDLLNSLKAQSYQDFDHHVIENLPSQQAHQQLYEAINNNVDTYTYFLKLDADMVFLHERALEKIIDYLAMDGCDHLVYPVQDFCTNEAIYGVHCFSNQVRWPQLKQMDTLFVDQNPDVTTHKAALSSEPLISHLENPSAQQLARFGNTRALKAFQPRRVLLQPRGKELFRQLLAVACHHKMTGDERLLILLAEAEKVRKQTSPAELSFWFSPRIAWVYWWLFYGIRCVPLWIIQKLGFYKL